MTDIPRMELTESGIVFTFPMGHPSTIVVARVIVVCPLHPKTVITEHHLHADGQSAVVDLPGFSTEFVSDQEIRLPGRAPRFVATPDAVVSDPNDVPHSRYRYACPRPSCRVDMQRRADGPMGMSSLMEGLLTRLRDSSIDSLTITNIDQDPWRVVTELSAQ